MSGICCPRMLRPPCGGEPDTCEAHAQVSDAGDVLYVLPQNFRAIIRGRSWLLRLEPALKGATNAAEYLLRVSFGTALVASVALVTLTIVALLTASSSSDRNDRRSASVQNEAWLSTKM